MKDFIVLKGHVLHFDPGLASILVSKGDKAEALKILQQLPQDPLIDAMLTPSQLTIGADEWLTIVARSGVTNNRDQSPGDAVESSKGIIRVKGSVLAAFRAGTITKEEALKQVEVKQQ